MKIKEFNSKAEIFNYVIKKFKKDSEVITLGGSSKNKPLKKFSDLDFNVFSKKYFRPYYEIVLVNKKPILISAYPQKFVRGNKTKPPKDQLILFGEYNNNLKMDYSISKYERRGEVIRECQLALDFLFKYARTNNKQWLEKVQKRLQWDYRGRNVK